MSENRVDIIPTENEGEDFLSYYLGETQEEAEETYHLFSNTLNIVSSVYSKNTGIDSGELFGAALEGLAKAKRDWEPDRGNCSFKSYAMLRIKTAMNECCRRNKSIISIPEYIRVANIYITNIKTILQGYGEPSELISFVLRSNSCSNIKKVHPTDLERLEKELAKLERLASNAGVPYENLIERGEYVPTDSDYIDDTMMQDEMYESEKRRRAAALMVSKLQDTMTESELHVANGIMSGKSYEEIGASHNPPRSIGWVQTQLENMREKFNGSN